MDKSVEELVKSLLDSDKELINWSWGEKFEDDDEIDSVYGVCKIKHPKDKILHEIKVCKDSQEHGKEFEKTLKILFSTMISGNIFFDTKDTSAKFIEKAFGGISYPADINIPRTKVFFLESTEHQNDEKDIDTNQILGENTRILQYHPRFADNPILKYTSRPDLIGVRSHYQWNYHDQECEDLRKEAFRWIGTGMNIKCAKGTNKHSKSTLNILRKAGFKEDTWVPTGIDCAKCTVFYDETMKDNWIFVIGVWEQTDIYKCIKGVYFIKMTTEDHDILWGVKDPSLKDELRGQLKEITNKISGLAKFNNESWKKAMHYYGCLSACKKRMKAKWKIEWDDDAKEEKKKMPYIGCKPLLDVINKTLRSKTTGNKSIMGLTPKVQVDKPQNRIQCNMNKGNFLKWISGKIVKKEAVYSEDFNYLFKPVSSKTRFGSEGADKSKQGGGGKAVIEDEAEIVKGEEDEYFLYNEKYYHENTDFYFDDQGNPLPFDMNEFGLFSDYHIDEDKELLEEKEPKQDIETTDGDIIYQKVVLSIAEKCNVETKKYIEDNQNEQTELDGEPVNKIGYIQKWMKMKPQSRQYRQARTNSEALAFLGDEGIRPGTRSGLDYTPPPPPSIMRQTPKLNLDTLTFDNLLEEERTRRDSVDEEAWKKAMHERQKTPHFTGEEGRAKVENFFLNSPSNEVEKQKALEEAEKQALVIKTPKPQPGEQTKSAFLPAGSVSPKRIDALKRRAGSFDGSARSSERCAVIYKTAFGEIKRILNKHRDPEVAKQIGQIISNAEEEQKIIESNVRDSRDSFPLSGEFSGMSLDSKSKTEGDSNQGTDGSGSDSGSSTGGGGKKKKRRRRRTKKKRRRKKKTRYRR